MCRRFFRADTEWDWINTAQGILSAPRIILSTRFSIGGSQFGPPTPCQWDTGSHLSVMSEQVAHALGIDLDREPDTRIRGVTGVEVPAWLVTRYVRFPGLCGWQFKLRFLVQQGAEYPVPLIGLLDTHDNFDVYTHGDDYIFFLRDTHNGEPLPPDADCRP